MNNEIQLSHIKELLPDYVCLHYVNYDDNLNNTIDLLQSCVADNTLDKVIEYIYDAIIDNEASATEQYMKEVQDSIMKKYGFKRWEADRLVFDTYEEDIQNMLYDKNESDPVGELLRNTSAFSIFLDTGLEVEDGSWRWTRSEETKWLKKIKRKLKITSSQWDNNIRVMLSQASYGGQLVVYFYETADSLITNTDKEWESVSFTNPAIAIINTANGSGDHTHLNGHTFSMPFVRGDIFIDKYFKYNYVSAVCGMSQDWCRDSKAAFSFEKVKGKKNTVSSLAGQALQDREYAKTYRKGGCTFGDMDIRRHRDVYYINNFPCGSKCPHCGTFWID